MSNVVLGIHSNITAGGFTGGHAWISVTQNGITTYYGLWPDDHPDTVDNGIGSDIRTGLEKGPGTARRYYSITNAQKILLDRLLAENVHWRYTNNCSSWASDTVLRVLGIDVDADDNFGIETPRELGRNILLLERKNPTKLKSPNSPAQASSSSSSG
jgi:hypothetical protein